MDNNQISVSTFNKLAQVYQDKYMDLPLYHRTYDVLCARINPYDNVLDIGCGPGNISRYLLDHVPSIKLLGTDLAPNMVELARLNNPEAHFEVMDCRAVADLDRQFDVIVCGFCLPYLNKEQANSLISAMSACLTDTGILYLSTMEGDYLASCMQTSSSGDNVFIYYHDGDELTRQLDDNGLTLVWSYRQDYPERGDVDLFLIAKKGI
ncbi:class I SAM-dependent methyltransferase [Shewanella psychrotolerans]|uniref:class I SAM-dependent methyltransferase n=1 Tax=Shewanella psychrotolerans TaxID=2864206 RepID=UPI001C656B4E|nr:class I SAM-dependent methyltransferase [Shewanella psychrotolerans]QYK02809.1 methyltransferase domain-containing protein [Shewanella psychrotolerans]